MSDEPLEVIEDDGQPIPDEFLLFRIKDEAKYKELRQLVDDADSMFDDSMFDDLPDGAYWAACEEFGAGQDIQLAVDDYERRHKLNFYSKEN